MDGEAGAEQPEAGLPGERSDMEGGGDFSPPEPILRVAELVADRKAHEVVALDLRGISSATDYFLIASGRSDVQVKAIAEHVQDELKAEGVRASHVEGMGGGRWVLMDYIDFVVHVFHPQAREFYQLETLWGDAPAHRFPDEEETNTE